MTPASARHLNPLRIAQLYPLGGSGYRLTPLVFNLMAVMS